MEIPRYWREMPTNMNFSGKEKNIGSGLTVYKFPGGEIPLMDDVETIRNRFITRGFNPEVADEILARLFYTVATEPAISASKIMKDFLEMVGSEVRK